VPRFHTESAARLRMEGSMVDDDRPDPQWDAMTARLFRREALRRAASEMNTTSGPGLESVLARISAEVTSEAAAHKTSTARAGEVEVRKHRG
jgi:hypothetical protein